MSINLIRVTNNTNENHIEVIYTSEDGYERKMSFPYDNTLESNVYNFKVSGECLEDIFKIFGYNVNFQK